MSTEIHYALRIASTNPRGVLDQKQTRPKIVACGSDLRPTGP